MNVGESEIRRCQLEASRPTSGMSREEFREAVDKREIRMTYYGKRAGVTPKTLREQLMEILAA